MHTQRGSLLIEVLIVISVLAIILSLGAQASLVGLSATKLAGDKDVALNLMNETFEAVNSASDEKWQNVYSLSKTSTNPHYATSSTGTWNINNAGNEVITVNGVAYTRYFYVDNVSRDAARSIENVYNSANDDPSTQKVTVTVLWGNANGNVLSTNQYISRWRNKVCIQTDWSGGAATGVKTCPDTTYGSQDGNIKTTSGTLTL